MKRRNRTISILSMSALDVLAMATGVSCCCWSC
jgi:hypothetical protein